MKLRLLFVVVLTACGTSPAADAGSDAAVAGDAGLDAAGPDDAAMDAGRLEWNRYLMSDGRTVEGETIATYDHSIWWWDPSDQITFGVFDPRMLGRWPDDRSAIFLSSLEVVASTPIARPTGAPLFREAMRGAGVVLERPPLDGVSYVFTGGESYHLEESGYGSFAWDLVQLDAAGNRFEGLGAANDDYLVWDAEVFAPTGGVVVEVVTDAPDGLPGTTDRSAVNNLVGIQLYGGYYVYLLHFRQGTIAPGIIPGARVAAGDLLGRVGNSGVSAEPHLHVVVLAFDRRAPTRTWSVPGEWTNVWVSSGRRSRFEEHFVPAGGTWISSGEF